MTGDGERALEALAAGALRDAPGRAREVFERAWPQLTRHLRIFLQAQGVPGESREDCGQAVLLRVWRSRRTYRGTSTPELLGWIYRISQRERLRMIDTAQRRPSAETDLRRSGEDGPGVVESSPDVARPDEAAERLDELALRRALDECIERLPEKQRAVVELLYSAAEWTERDAAGVLGLSKSYVHSLRQDALRKLEACLKSKGGA